MTQAAQNWTLSAYAHHGITAHPPLPQVGRGCCGSPQQVQGPLEVLVPQLHLCPLTPDGGQVINILEGHLQQHGCIVAQLTGAMLNKVP